ncbi:MAG TPA: amidophosphoribosyltransferase [Fimbriimonadaceae bacterium]|nr:amidophosphoribosyltransferase [Fimbriimonadaceae bacterium]HRJ34055.1 amidophosphoribosyltransferase [Fimbriimonadaceae bacterium]
MKEVDEQDRPKEECGILGLYTPSGEAARLAFFGLFALQHRGQESAGIAVSDGETVRMHKEMGLVSQAFNEQILSELPGHLAIGHTRYSTTGASVLRNAQPIFCTSIVGEIAVAHNGNLLNAGQVRQKMIAEGERFDSTSDTEVMARLMVRHMDRGPENAVAATMREIEGAYSVAVLTPDRLIGFRDPNGVRPLVAGRVADGFMLASESCAFGPVDGHVERELEPGEMVIIDNLGMRYAQGAPPRRKAMCLFEYIYFARPDSHMGTTSLYAARERMGENLWKEHPVEADIVVPVPDSGVPAAHGLARASGLPFQEAMVKSRYIHRTFIVPDQRLRELGVRMKLTPMIDKIRGQRLILVDDSIVRATTTKQLVKMMFDAGAAEVHVRITAPPIQHPCFYGIDMSSKGELAAAQMSIEQIREHLGATTLGYLSIEGAVAATGGKPSQFCLACFNGDYPIPVPEDVTKSAFESPPEVGELATVKAH